MQISTIKPIIALNKVYFKDNLLRADLEYFKDKIKILYNHLEDAAAESEENLKNLLADFLKQTFYEPDFFINTKGRTDLAIHKGKSAKDAVSVLFETKKPNSADLCHPAKPNTKAFQQLVLYYMQERVSAQNIDIQHLIVTDFYQWYVFDENQFDKHFYQNATFLKRFKEFELSAKSTDVFYKEIAKPFLDELDVTFTATHFTLQTLEYLARKDDEQADIQLIPYYKILSPIHLLKLPFANDSNTLDKNFYTELLHIMGLEEVKTEGKKLIQRKKVRDEYSLLENTLTKIQNKGFLHLPNVKNWGQSPAEQAENIALELCLTWVNRILFLKLLEGQLVRYQRGNKIFCFLNPELLYDFNRVNKLFFEVLAERPENRTGKTKSEFAHIPYLNSSLFERTELECNLFEINYLDDNENLQLWSNTVLKDAKGNRSTGEMPTLKYFLAFLEAYNFASEGAAGIQEDKRTLINAAVLGLIFEKINGYKDGSFFTPGFITMYMSRETIRRAVLQKFQQKGYKALNFNDLNDEISDRKTANALVNSLKICDPAVGSGHFLVSALNELLAVKSDLGILQYRDGKRVKDFKLEVVNDELVVFDEDAEAVFEYTLSEKGGAISEKQRIQEMLFGEKQFLIEHCLFGVDINPNSVKICRLRLWIELLKNAFYTSESNYKALETLPNIDINIKQGNSLISRFGLESDLSEVFKKKTFSVEKYRKAVADYKKTNSKTVKNDLTLFIDQIKDQFKSIFYNKMPENRDLAKYRGQLLLAQSQSLFESEADKIEIARLQALFEQAEKKVDAIKNNFLFQNAFEWRFEFPEVLDDDGRFLGFDVVIGNPPYFALTKIKDLVQGLNAYKTYSKSGDIYCLFYERSMSLLKPNAYLTFITSNSWLKTQYGQLLRQFLIQKSNPIHLLNIEDTQVFTEATVESNVLITQKALWDNHLEAAVLTNDFDTKENMHAYFQNKKMVLTDLKEDGWIIGSSETIDLKTKLEKIGKPLKDWNIQMNIGITTGFNEAFVIDEKTKAALIQKDAKNAELIKPMLRGRDLKKYCFSYQKLYIINTHNGLRKRLNPIRVVNDYPTLMTHFSKYQKQLEKRSDQGVHWTNLRNCAYMEDFEKDKIIWGELSDKPKFSLDTEGYYMNNTMLMMTGNNIKYILGILNSKLGEWYFNQITTTSGMGTNRWLKYKIEQLPIKVASEMAQQPIIALVGQILAQKKADSSVSTADLEAAIDKLVYELYDLNESEIALIEKAIS